MVFDYSADIVTDLLVIPSLDQLVSCSLDKTVRVWDMCTGSLRQVRWRVRTCFPRGARSCIEWLVSRPCELLRECMCAARFVCVCYRVWSDFICVFAR